jgi:molecular chaperone DnaJ
MDGRTYYMILGVSPTESPGGIRSAYRDLAKRLHPDVAGAGATHVFQEISEAYDVLSDPQRRRAYNDELRRAEGGDDGPARPSSPQPARPPVSIFAAAEASRPSFEAMYDRIRRDFTGMGNRTSERLAGLNLEVVLTPEEGRQGCVLPIRVPICRHCPACAGSGRDWLSPCPSCAQRGTIEDEQIVRVRIPAMVRTGSVFEMPLRGLGIRNFYLRLHVFVEAQVVNERR